MINVEPLEHVCRCNARAVIFFIYFLANARTEFVTVIRELFAAGVFHVD